MTSGFAQLVTFFTTTYTDDDGTVPRPNKINIIKIYKITTSVLILNFYMKRRAYRKFFVIFMEAVSQLMMVKLIKDTHTHTNTQANNNERVKLLC